MMLVANVAAADSVTFFFHSESVYLYKGSQSDGDWNVGDTITLTGLDHVFRAQPISGFSVEFSQYAATWTCTQATTTDPLWFTVESTEGEGSVTWGIDAESTSSGGVTGPAYVPEPATTALFSAGLLALGIGVVRRRKSSRP